MKRSKGLKENTVRSSALAAATLGCLMIIFGLLTLILLIGLAIFNKTFDLIVFLPIVPTVLGLALIKVSKVDFKKVYPGIVENIVAILFPFV